MDDTLIDTSGTIIPWKLQKVLAFLEEKREPLPSQEEALATLLRIHINSTSTKSTLKEFFSLMDLNSQYLDSCYKIIYEEFSPLMPIELKEGASELLQTLSEKHHLALVTIGKKDYQQFKMEKAGIDFSIFSTIDISEEGDKKPYYRALREALGIEPQAVCVCGDKIEADLVPAKQLGFKTIHIRRGQNPIPKKWKPFVDFSIYQLKNILPIINSLQESFENQLGTAP